MLHLFFYIPPAAITAASHISPVASHVAASPAVAVVAAAAAALPIADISPAVIPPTPTTAAYVASLTPRSPLTAYNI